MAKTINNTSKRTKDDIKQGYKKKKIKKMKNTELMKQKYMKIFLIFP